MPVALDDSIYCSPFPPVLSLDQLMNETDESGVAFDVPAPAARLDERLDETRAADILWRHVAGLPARQAAVLLFVYQEGFSAAATAKALGISGAAVSKLRAKGLARLLAVLAPQRDALLA